MFFIYVDLTSVAIFWIDWERFSFFVLDSYNIHCNERLNESKEIIGKCSCQHWSGNSGVFEFSMTTDPVFLWVLDQSLIFCECWIKSLVLLENWWEVFDEIKFYSFGFFEKIAKIVGLFCRLEGHFWRQFGSEKFARFSTKMPPKRKVRLLLIWFKALKMVIPRRMEFCSEFAVMEPICVTRFVQGIYQGSEIS